MEYTFKGSLTPWKFKHSESKEAFNIVGTRLGGKYKIARIPYQVLSEHSETNEVLNERNRMEAQADALLIAHSPQLLEMLEKCLPYIPSKLFDEAQSLLKSATEVNL